MGRQPLNGEKFFKNVHEKVYKYQKFKEILKIMSKSLRSNVCLMADSQTKIEFFDITLVESQIFSDLLFVA